MITINLLPEEIQHLRKKKLLTLKLNLFAILGAIVFAGLLVAFHLGLFAYNVFLNARLAKMQGVYETIKPEADKILALKEKTDQLIRKKNVVLSLIENRIIWAQKLNELSDLLPGQVWLNDLEIKRQSEQIAKKVKMPDGTMMEKMETVYFYVLEYNGGVISLERREMLYLVGNFIANIKNNESFFSLFEDIELVNTQREQDKGTGREYMKFTLQSRLKSGII